MTYPLPPTFINDTTQGGVGAVSAQNLNDYTTAITGLDGRASLLEAMWVNVKAHGATGNGTTDDTSAIQSVINGKGVIFFPPGTYKLSSALTVGSDTTLIGAGPHESILLQTSTTANGITGVDLTHIGIRDLRITGPGAYTGSGNGINFSLSGTAGNATFYVSITNVYEENFGVDGISIATPIVSHFDRVWAFKNGRHGLHFHGDPVLQSDGTSTAITACFAAGNHGAGYRLFQMAYSALNGCAADANGIGYEIASCLGVTANGCGSEEPYDFSAFNAGYTGLAWKISATRTATINSPYMIMNIFTSFWVTSASHVTINNMFEGSPGNPGAPVSTPTNSLLVDSGCTVIANDPVVSTATNLATGTTTILPGAIGSGGGAIPTATVTQKGDLLVATLASTVTREAVGSDGNTLTADSTQTTGIAWKKPGWDHIGELVLTSAAATTGAITIPTYDQLMLVITVASLSASDQIALRFNGDTAAHYWARYITSVAGGTTLVNTESPSAVLAPIGGSASALGRVATVVMTNTTATKVGIVSTQLATGVAAAVGQLDIAGGIEWVNGSKITSVTALTVSSATMAAGSGIMIYGKNFGP